MIETQGKFNDPPITQDDNDNNNHHNLQRSHDIDGQSQNVDTLNFKPETKFIARHLRLFCYMLSGSYLLRTPDLFAFNFSLLF
jgi:hypothetical protein